jgi:aromatic-amino-acid transaminase
MMLDQLEAQSPDALLALIKMYASDDRSDKIDLGVGVYRTEDGDTPVFAAIKAAERRLLEEQDSKSYLGPEGDSGFVNALMPIIFGSDATMAGRLAGMQTPGGTGAVRLALGLAREAGVTRIHLGTPSWPNHAQIIADLGLELVPFDHATADGTANVDAALAAIRGASANEAIVLHGCCHNPSGIDYEMDGWEAIGDAVVKSGIFPIIDTAYQGLGRGLEEDVAGLRSVLAKVPEAAIAYSCDKNFGLYRDRVGAFYILADGKDTLDKASSNANSLARAAWSMPPDHGAAAVRLVLRDAELTQDWEAELEGMRERIRAVRQRLAETGTAGRIDLVPLGEQNGLFSTLALNGDEVRRLREDHAIYMAGSGRINIAGLSLANLDTFVEALAKVTR